jgi:hypothetical protein
MDRTASARMARYRGKLARERGIRRLELQVPSEISEEVKTFARRLRTSVERVRQDARTQDLLGLALGTINAPRPRQIDAKTLLNCIRGTNVDRIWRPHVEAFVTELSADLIYDLVLAGVFTFEELDRARRIWRIQDGRNIDWIAEMADLELAGLAA